MSEHADPAHATAGGAASSHAAPAPPAEELFTPREIEQFDADDVVAGSTIGKMLSLFFLYTVIVMSIVAWWTYKSTLPAG